MTDHGLPTIGLKLGRVDVADVLSVDSFDFADGLLSFSGRIAPTVIADAAEVRAQLLGLVANPDEPDVPGTLREDPAVDGYYRVGDVRVEVEPGRLVEGYGRYRYSVKAQRIPGKDVPLIEHVSIGGHRANSHAAYVEANVDPWYAVPTDVVDQWDGVSASHQFDFQRVCSEGTLGVNLYAAGIAKRVGSFTLAPASWYVGAARIHHAGTGSRLVVGSELVDTDGAGGWVLSNDLVEVYAGATPGSIAYRRRNGAGSAWRSAIEWELGFDSPELTIDTLTTVTVLRNSPQVCALRLGLRVGNNLHRHYLDVTLRRGAYLAEFRWRTDTALLGVVRPVVGVAGTAVGAGISASAGTYRYVALCATAVTVDTLTGEMARNTLGTSFEFALGEYEHGVAGSELDMREQYFGTIEPRLVVVGR